MSEPGPVPPGGVVGILGGGQLGRMLALAAAELGLACHIYSPDRDSPAFAVTRAHTRAAWDDEAALASFADDVDVVTFEFENVPAETAAFLARRRPVQPHPHVLAVTQDRLAEKRLFVRLGIAVPHFAEVGVAGDIPAALARVGAPAVLKARRFGYDGKGQTPVTTDDNPIAAWRAIGAAPAILEETVRFDREISVAVARGADGALAVYDVSENLHRDRMLAAARVPARIAPRVADEARDIGRRVAEALDYVGLLAVEMFLLERPEGARILANEIAPRVHNSFHWTQDACLVSQFEQHIRAVCGWPLGDPSRHSDAEMRNLIGGAEEEWHSLAAEHGARLHLYGKAESRPGRKMGHVTRVYPRGTLPAGGERSL